MTTRKDARFSDGIRGRHGSARLTRNHLGNYAHMGALLAEKERRRSRLSRRIVRLLQGKPAR